MPHLLEAALKYRFEIAPFDLEWLGVHDGLFMKFIHPNSKRFRSILSRKKYKGRIQDYVEQAVLTSNHSVVGYSPRFIGRDLSSNYFDNKEHWLCVLWNFLAIIGDYESMLILLSAPPPNCPSVNFASAQGLVLHKFNVPLAPLCHSWEGGDPFLDRNGTPILSEGNVDNFNGTSTLVAALNCLHPRHAKGGDSQLHTKTCQACYDNYWLQSSPLIPTQARVSQYTPCATQTDEPCRYCNRGNPQSYIYTSRCSQAFLLKKCCMSLQLMPGTGTQVIFLI